MNLLAVGVILVVALVVFYLFNTYIALPPPLKLAGNVVLMILLILALLWAFGLLASVGTVRM
jgi:hypothetical protein